MNKLIFLFILILLTIFLFIYFIFNNNLEKIKYFESFAALNNNIFNEKDILNSKNMDDLGSILTDGIADATKELQAKIETTQQSNIINDMSDKNNLNFFSFIIFEDRIYAIGTNNSIKNIYCSYLNSQKWFKLVDNPDNGPLSTSVLLDIVVLRNSSNILLLIALYDKNLLYIKNIEDNDSTFTSINFGETRIEGSITQIITTQNLIFLNIKSQDDSLVENEDDDILNSGIYSFNITTKEIDSITFSSSYSKICTNQYKNMNVLYGLFLLDDNPFNKTNICVKKNIEIEDNIDGVSSSSSSINQEETEYDKSFLFEKDFIDLFITDNYLYGLTNNSDKYIYRKSINVDIVGTESFLWYKVSSMVDSFLEQTNTNGIQNKLISVYDGYIYCIINKKIKKQKINGFEWINYNNKDNENQYYPLSSKTIIDKINNNIDNIENNIENSSFDAKIPFKFFGIKK